METEGWNVEQPLPAIVLPATENHSSGGNAFVKLFLKVTQFLKFYPQNLFSSFQFIFLPNLKTLFSVGSQDFLFYFWLFCFVLFVFKLVTEYVQRIFLIKENFPPPTIEWKCKCILGGLCRQVLQAVCACK